jgi:ribosomal protein S27E
MTTNGAPPAGQAIRCPKCALSLEATFFGPGAWVECPACRSALSAFILPAMTHPPDAITSASGERAIEGEAVCFFHPEKRAAASCQRCGRFLCALCDVPFGGKHLCPSCLDSAKLPELVSRRLVWGQLARILGWWPLLCLLICFPLWFVVFATGPAAIIAAIIGWNKPPSLVHGHRHGAAIMGMIGGAIQLCVMAGFGWFMTWAYRQPYL